MKPIEQRSTVRFALPVTLVAVGLAVFQTTPDGLLGVSGQALKSVGYAMYTASGLFFVAVLNDARNPLLEKHSYDRLRKAFSSYGGVLIFCQIHGILPESTLLLATGIAFIIGTMAGVGTQAAGVTIDDFPDEHQLLLKFE